MFDTAFDPSFLSGVQTGVMRTRYRGVPMWKSPFDLVLYLQLLDRLRPVTIIEIGTKAGGSALWFADMLSVRGVEPIIVSIDIDSSPEIHDPRIRFLQGDVMNLAAVLDAGLLANLPHPWLIVEDSAHFYETSLAALEFFDTQMRSGDYIVIEDGIVATLPGQQYRRYQNGPTRAVADFLRARPESCELDRSLCDFYGRNITWNPGGWLRKK